MFVITDDPIDVQQARTDLQDESCGALVTFEGRVRDHNQGKNVTKLHYEAYRSLAVTEGEVILKELLEEYDIHRTHSLHRVGNLDLNELSFWLGVAAPHREEAFGACSTAVDRIKDRVPIWKKEFYENGTSRWINKSSLSENE